MIHYVLSYGGGLNSTTLLVYLVKNNRPLDCVLFADTGDEFEHTYATVAYYKEWLHQQKPGIIFEIVQSHYNKSLYQYCWDKKIVPSRMTRDCTDKFKIQPMRRFLLKQWGKKNQFVRYIGIDYSEAHRIRNATRKNEINVYPLVEAKIGRYDCKKLLKSYGLPIPEKSGCWYCPFTSKQTWKTMSMHDPTRFDKAIAFEQNHRHYPRPVSLLNSQPLLYIKNRTRNQTQLSDFTVDEPSCDVAGSCFL